ncbi:MAG: radical SAM protein [Bacteroidales bacterium]|nr:MAG: radical SAM protein [Bacteroidales bacterium]
MICYGPVTSRRLGNSLGINNIVAPKVCSYGCIYCQLGKTLRISNVRQTFFKPEEIFETVKHHIEQLKGENKIDYLTFVANGEPTLDENLGKSIICLKELGIPIAVITNASMLFLESARNDLILADWVSVKLDAPDKQTWQTINHPFTGLTFGQHLDNLKTFRIKYKGILCTETMLLEGINDSTDCINRTAKIVKDLNPNKAYISIPIRPPADSRAKTPSSEKIAEAWQIFADHQIKTELLNGFEGTKTGYTGNAIDDILNITSVHPLREDSVKELLEKDNADFSVIESLISKQQIKETHYNSHKYYVRQH